MPDESNSNIIKNKNSSVCIAVLSYNHPHITERCLISILKLVNEKNILLTHHGSTNAHVQYLINQFPNIHHFVINENKGYAFGANQTIEQAFHVFNKSKTTNHTSNPSILFLTNDLVLTSIPSTPFIGFSSILLYQKNEYKINSLMGLIDLKKGRLSHLKNEQEINFFKNKLRQIYIPGTAFWMDLQSWSKLGGFDESFHTYWEDVDLSYRSHSLNIPLFFDENTKAIHFVGKTCHKNRFYTFFLYQRNRGRFMTKHSLSHIVFYFYYFLDLFRFRKNNFNNIFKILTTFSYKHPIERKD